MKQNAVAAILFAVVLAVTMSVAAQTSKTETKEQNDSPSVTMHKSKVGQDMMSGGMMGMMGQMSAHHQEMSKLLDQTMRNMSAMRNEKDPAALKSKMDEQEALLKEMHDQMMQQGGMMTKMYQMMSGHGGMGCQPASNK